MFKSDSSTRSQRKLFLVALVIGHLWITYLLVGVHDLFAFVWLLFSAYLIKDVVLEFQMGGRRLLANHVKPDSEAHKLISTPGVFSHVFAFIIAVLLSIGFFVTATGIIKSHGLIPVSIMLAITTYVLFSGLMPSEDVEKIKGELRDDKLGQKQTINDVARSLEAGALKYANFVMKLVLITLIINVILAFVLSAHDTFKFATTDIGFSNFDTAATDDAIQYNGANYYTRALLNAYILADFFKIALANSLFQVFVGSDDKGSYFYVFYIFTLAFNLIKLVPFSIGFVLTARGYRQRSDSLLQKTTLSLSNWTPRIRRLCSTFTGYSKQFFIRVKSIFISRRQK